MKMPLLAGRDLRWDDEYPSVAVVNERFARRYFGGQSPIGHTFEILSGGFQGTARVPVRIVGLTRDARYEDMRVPIPATAYVPFRPLNGGAERKYGRATFLVRTKAPDPMSLASMLRQEIPREQPQIRVANIVTQEELVRSQIIRERLLATLSLFFAAVALIVAAVGLYGVLNYAVLERRREFGIRIALGAPGGDIAWQVTAEVFSMLALGAAVGLALGLAAERSVATLLYQVKATDPSSLALPVITMSAVALLAALPPVVRAIRFDPAALLRTE
jgi:ABC-type antimicrobial peptide transport system permease subunit